MPVVAVNLAPTVFAEIHSLVARGLYASPEQFLEIAAFNQTALERGAKPEELPARSKSSVQKAISEQPARVATRTAKRAGSTRRTATVAKKRYRPAPAPTLEAARAPFAGKALGVPSTRPSTPQPETDRLWGQVNRLFPMKLVCRWLATNEAAALERLAPRIGEAASALGSALEAVDAAAGRRRDDVLATGLPRNGNVASMDRFLSQYLARTTRGGDIYPGAVKQYALVAFDGETPALTEAGFAFGGLANPILDAPAGSKPSDSLSDAEREVLIHHVLKFVPAERDDLALVLGTIRGGAATPDELMVAVRSSFPNDWSEVMARTHLSGVVARAADLGVLKREWEGRRVTYKLTSSARTFALGTKESS